MYEQWRQKSDILTLRLDLMYTLTVVIILCNQRITNELPHDKPTNWHVSPAKTQINLGICSVWSESLLCPSWVAKDPVFFHADSEDWSDWAEAQADLSLRWTQRSFVGSVMRWLKCADQTACACWCVPLLITCQKWVLSQFGSFLYPQDLSCRSFASMGQRRSVEKWRRPN